MTQTASTSGAFARLQQLMKKPRKSERCELCANDLPPVHAHLVEPANRRLLCCCEACSILLSGDQNPKYRRVPTRVLALTDMQMSDVQWESLHLPINLAFFFRSSTANRVIAMFPSPATAMESLLTLEAWTDLTADNPALAAMQPDVEAFLANRVGDNREYFIVPIDECYKLVGLVRIHWRGLSGGTEVWKHLAAFFAELKERSVSDGAVRA